MDNKTNSKIVENGNLLNQINNKHPINNNNQQHHKHQSNHESAGSNNISNSSSNSSPPLRSSSGTVINSSSNSPIKKELSPHSTPFVPNILFKDKGLSTSGTPSNANTLSITTTLSSSSGNTIPTTLVNNSTTNSIQTNSKREMIENLFKNRFHIKNNIRETVLSAISSVFVMNDQTMISSNMDAIKEMYQIIMNENSYIIHQFTGKNKKNKTNYIIPPTTLSPPTSSQTPIPVNIPLIITTPTSTPPSTPPNTTPESKREQRKKSYELRNKQKQQIIQQPEPIVSTTQSPSFKSMISNLNQIEINRKVDSNSNDKLELPDSIPKADNDSFYVRVLEYNIKLLTKMNVKGYNQDLIQTYFFTIYKEIQQLKFNNLELIQPTLLICLGDLITLRSLLPNNINTVNDIIISEFKKIKTSGTNTNNLSSSSNNSTTSTPPTQPVSTINEQQYLANIESTLFLLNSFLKLDYEFNYQTNDLLRKLLNLVYYRNDNIQITLSSILKKLLSHHNRFNDDQIKKILNISLFKLSDNNNIIQFHYLDLLTKIIPILDLNQQRNFRVNDLSLQFKQLIMRNTSTLLLNSTHFKIIFDWLLSSPDPNNNNNNNSTILNDQNGFQKITEYLVDQFTILNVISHLSIEKERKRVEALISQSSELVWFWVIWELSRYCIINKLKTPYGSAVQSFEIFEKILSKLNKERNDFRKLKIILQFMDSLEKLIFSTANGSIILSSSANIKEIQFFRHNVRVSEDWFSRIRINLLKASIIFCSTSDIIRHATLRIQDIRADRFVDSNSVNLELEFCILHLTNALQQISEYESLQGIEDWYDFWSTSKEIKDGKDIVKLQNQYPTLLSTIPINSQNHITINGKSSQSHLYKNSSFSNLQLKLPWLKGVVLRSNQQYENSNYSLTSIPQLNQQDFSNSLSFPFIIEQIIKSYLDLSDFQEVEQFIQKHQSQIYPQDHSKIIFKESYLKSLASFYKGDLETASQFLSESDTISTVDSPFGILGKQIETDEYILKTLILQKLNQKRRINSGSPNSSLSSSTGSTGANQEEFILDGKNNIIHTFTLLGMESNVQSFQYLSQLKILNELDLGMTSHQTISTKGTFISQLGYLERLRRIRNHISFYHSRSDILFQNIPNTEKIIKLSRKSGNFKLCERLLNSILESHSPFHFIEKTKLKYQQFSNDLQKRLDITMDLMKHVHSFPDHFTPQLKAKSYLLLIKFLQENKNSYEFQQHTPTEQFNPIYYFKKSTSQLPNSSKLWITYANYMFNLSKSSNNNLDIIKTSLDSYFQYLNCQDSYKKESLNTHVTLQILNILHHHSNEVSEIIDKYIGGVSVSSFTNIIPQLFARLTNNPDKYVQSQVSDLINKISIECPQKIIYQVLVAFNSNPSNPTLQSLKRLLTKHNDQLVRETEILITELERMTVLWDDSWQYLMEQIQGWLYVNTKVWHDNNQVKQLKVNRVNFNKNLLQPIIDKLKNLSSSTLLSIVSTPHEKWFLKVYFEVINKTIRLLEKQSKPSSPFEPLHELIHTFSVNRLSVLSLSSINPTLYEFRPQQLLMPGLANSGGPVNIQSIQTTIYLLPTKTKPKKISFIGQDGHVYPYLLKGKEDLHLDERIMQLLSIIDKLLISSSCSSSPSYTPPSITKQFKNNLPKKSLLKLMKTRNYAVIPLSQSSGLIQWVEGSVPLFSFYKNWYRSETAYSTTGSSSSSTIPNTPILLSRIPVRPVDIYFSKLNPLLEERGILGKPRSEWPKDITNQVYMELVNETPRWLLSRELWFSSASNSEYFLKCQAYSRSLALMSMIGYIIGLGDRHLDNMLIDLKSGEIVHIDYNICFDKGIELRVPEKVPFRMTQVLEYALGLTGIKGTFRESSLAVMELLRNNAQTILNLLEIFIYDPLFDWKHTSNRSKDNQGAGDEKVENETRESTKKKSTNNLGGKENGESQSQSQEDEDDNEEDDDNDQPTQQQQQTTPQKSTIETTSIINSEGIKSIQGINVVNQVKLKLEGTDQKLSVSDHVDHIIKESMKLENLSVMFEGWTQWV